MALAMVKGLAGTRDPEQHLGPFAVLYPLYELSDGLRLVARGFVP
jgi:hypothetical protein